MKKCLSSLAAAGILATGIGVAAAAPSNAVVIQPCRYTNSYCNGPFNPKAQLDTSQIIGYYIGRIYIWRF